MLPAWFLRRAHRGDTAAALCGPEFELSIVPDEPSSQAHLLYFRVYGQLEKRGLIGLNINPQRMELSHKEVRFS